MVRKLKILFIIVFVFVIILPILAFNLKEDYISSIDNRVLTDFPTAENSSGDLSNDIENYVNDRIGFRENMIHLYTVMNDKIFGVMVHPTYTYGEEGYVFFKMGRNIEYNDFHVQFVNMVCEIQRYCEERGVSFYFLFNPSKTSVYERFLPTGVNYDNVWVEQMISELEEREVNCIDNTDFLKELSQEEQVYNKQYDAGHWNDLGAFYGMNHLFERIHKDIPQVRQLSLEQFDITTKVETSLPVSQFEINEEVPEFGAKIEISNKTDEYLPLISEKLNNNYHYFHYLINEEDGAKELPKMLVFQGSYLNSRGEYIINNASEYIAIHNYQNILDFEYYYDIFQPECVVFEVAEYTLQNQYFDYERMKSFELPISEN